MTNVLDSTGLTVDSYNDVRDEMANSISTLYDGDVNLEQDSPDGQQVNLVAKVASDILNLLKDIYTSYDPEQAVGRSLDQRVAQNGIERQAGTYTLQTVQVTASKALTLYGLDQTDQPVFTVADSTGNQWKLLATYSFGGSGTQGLSFRASEVGPTVSGLNTITVQVTVISGVTVVNNPTTYDVLGKKEETDASLRIRRRKSVSIGSIGFHDGLLAALENLVGMDSAFVYENDTGSTDANGVPGHSIWVITSGTASSADIANVIYKKRNAACGMKGSVTLGIIQSDSSTFVIKWDTVQNEAIFIKVTLASIDAANLPQYAAIRAGLAAILDPEVNETLNVNDVATAIREIDSNALITSPGLATTSGGSYTNTKTPTDPSYKFLVTSANVILLPILVLPYTTSGTPETIVHGNTIQLSTLGGFGAITWSMHTTNNTGAVNASTGVYTAGTSTGGLNDVVRATDALGNIADFYIVTT